MLEWYFLSSFPPAHRLQYCSKLKPFEHALPWQNFVDALLYGGNRQIMLEHDYVQKGAFQAGRPATHTGRASRCRKNMVSGSCACACSASPALMPVSVFGEMLDCSGQQGTREEAVTWAVRTV